MGTQQKIWEILPNLFAAVRKSHEDVGLVGHHDFIHAARVGEIAQQIAINEWADSVTAVLTGAAGLCHNADRILQKYLVVGRADVSQKQIASITEDWLENESFFHTDSAFGSKYKEAVVNAVLKHNGKNSANDWHVLIALMDADRVVNLDVDLFIRSGQNYHDLPTVDHKNWLCDPEATYSSPRSVLKDIAYSLDWVNPKSDVCVRTHLGKKLAYKRAEVFQMFFTALKKQLEEEGVRPYPFR